MSAIAQLSSESPASWVNSTEADEISRQPMYPAGEIESRRLVRYRTDRGRTTPA